jgi:transmembrane sensor
VKPAADEGEPLRGEAADWLMRLQASPRDTAVRAGLEAWLAASDSHRRAWESVERVWRLSGGLAPADAPPHGNVVELPRGRSRRVLAIAVAALAACIALYFAPIVKLRLQADHMTSIAELREVTLEDGSVVHLDAGSAIAVHYGASRREVVLLAGRAFFEVTPASERPFVVLAGDVAVTVTGTAFDVRSAGDEVTVAVQSGTVEVGLDGGARLAGVLTRGERLSVNRANRQATKSQIVAEDVAAWRERRLVVDGASLAGVVEELGRHHAGIIMLRDRSLAARRITGVFDLRRPVEALNAIARTQHGSVTEITPYLLVVSGGP